MKRLLVCALLTAAALLVAGSTPAEEKKKAAPAIDEKAMMEAYMKAGTPGEHHKKLEPLVGSWEFTCKMWMDPSKPPSESKGTAEHVWVMDRRFVYEKVKGNFDGMPFQGHGLIGYDNLQKKYTSTWVDNMSTAIFTFTGAADKSGKVFTFSGVEDCPLTGEKVKSRHVTTIKSNDSFETEFYKSQGGQEMKVMQITYTRKK